MADKSYRIISDTARLVDLITHLLDPKRRTTAVVITARKAGGGPCIAPVLAQKICGDHAQVYLLSPALLPDFNERFHHVFGIDPAGARIFRGGMTLDDHHMRHPMWNETRIDMMEREGRLAGELLQQVVEVRRFANGKDALREKPPERPAPVERTNRRPLLRISLPA